MCTMNCIDWGDLIGNLVSAAIGFAGAVIGATVAGKRTDRAARDSAREIQLREITLSEYRSAIQIFQAIGVLKTQWSQQNSGIEKMFDELDQSADMLKSSTLHTSVRVHYEDVLSGLRGARSAFDSAGPYSVPVHYSVANPLDIASNALAKVIEFYGHFLSGQTSSSEGK